MKMLTLLMLALAIPAFASELDNEKDVINAEQRALAQNLPASLVVRVSESDGSVSVLHSTNAIPAGDISVINSTEFQAVGANQKLPSELDRDSSTSGWYFYWYNYNYAYPTYYYYGYNYYYQPYYNYYWAGYYYYWYRWY